MATKKKIVLQLFVDNPKTLSNIMKLAVGNPGVTSIEVSGKDKDKLVIIGEGIDVFALTKRLKDKYKSKCFLFLCNCPGLILILPKHSVEIHTVEIVPEKKEEKKDEQPPPLPPAACGGWKACNHHVYEIHESYPNAWLLLIAVGVESLLCLWHCLCDLKS